MGIPDFDLTETFSAENLTVWHFVQIFVRMTIAAALGAIVAFRPWRRLIKNTQPPQMETAQAQTLMAAAGALMIAVIGDSPARAFGLVGLGAFIRFRTGIKDPRDAVLMFVMIGIGMACGRGLVPTAGTAAVFSIVIMSILDATGPIRPGRMRIGITADDPRAAVPLVRVVFPRARLIDIPAGTQLAAGSTPEKGKIIIEIDANEEMDAAEVVRLLDEQKIVGIRNVSLEDGKKGGG